MCENCKNLFDIKNNLPFILPCGHTLCEKCLNSLEFNNNKLECPIDSHIYEASKENIPKNEMLIEYILSNKLGPKYSYQIREYNIPEANFNYMDRRNCCQKIFRFFYKLFYVKIFLAIMNILLFPFKKIYQILKKIMNFLYIIYLKIKVFLLKIFKKIKQIQFPKLNVYFKFCEKFKIKLLHFHIVRTIIIFFKYTIRAPLWFNYLTLMRNLIYQSQVNVNNACFKTINILITLIGIILVHLFAYFTNNLDNLFIIVLLLNESSIVLFDFMKMDDEKKNKKYLKKNYKSTLHKERRNSLLMRANNTFDEEEEEYLIDENKYNRGKKCIIRWIGFIFYWYFSPIAIKLFYNFVSYWKGDGINVENLPEKRINILRGIINSLLLIPKLLVIIYLTS